MARRVTRREVLRSLGVGAGSIALAACGAPPAQTGVAPAASTAAGSAAASSAAASSAAATTGLPIVTAPLTLTYWTGISANVAATKQSYAEMTCYQELQKRTGIQLDFQHPPVDQTTEQFNLMIASGQYPDIIETNWLTFPGGPAKAIRDEIIVRLNELIDQHAPNLKKLLDENPEWRKQIVTDEGDIYCFPFLRGDPTLLTFAGPAVRQDWLDKAGLQSPTTIDEWRTMLQAFKGNDYNGNGQSDEWPFAPWLDTGPTIAFNHHAFIGAWGITNGFYQVDGTVKYGPLQPEYKDFLATMVDWYKEGLIDPDVVAMDQQTFDARMTSGQIGSGIMRVGGGIGKFMGLMRDKDPNFKLVGTAYPTLQAGEKPILGQRDNIYPGPNSAAISTANQHQVETVKLLDYAYGEDGHMLFNFGVEGVSYTLENGYPRYTDDVMKNAQGLPIVQAMGQHFRSNFGGPFVQDKRYAEQYFQLPEQREAYQIWSEPSNERLMPPVTPTEEESRRFARIMTDVETRFEEVFAKVFTGAQPLQSWDTFVGEMQQLGIEEAIQTQQAALDRYNQRT
jgi:putative aldouronate transport system substrate-binding protein